MSVILGGSSITFRHVCMWGPFGDLDLLSVGFVFWFARFPFLNARQRAARSIELASIRTRIDT